MRRFPSSPGAHADDANRLLLITTARPSRADRRLALNVVCGLAAVSSRPCRLPPGR